MITLIIIILFTFVILILLKGLLPRTELYNFAYYMNTYNIPIIPIEIDRKIFYFLIDTGATTSIVDFHILNRIKNNKILTGEKSSVVGIDGIEHEMEVFYMHGYINNNEFMIKTQGSNMDLSYLSDEIKISGLLGSEFFKTNKMKIDFKNYVIYY